MEDQLDADSDRQSVSKNLCSGGTTKRYTLGTHRVRTPEETWNRLTPILEDAGITRIADVTALDCLGIPVYQAIRPASKNLSVSQGKAITSTASKVSAAMEAVELWCAECLDHIPQVQATFSEMEKINPIPTEALPWRLDRSWCAEMTTDWVEARPLSAGGATGYLPRAFLELDFTMSESLKPTMFQLTSNGLASGNCREEALLHSVCEWIERHGLYLVTADAEHKTPIQEDSIDIPHCREIIRRIREAGMKLAVYDITWDAQVPVILAALAAPDLPNIWYGSGCHPVPEIALSRALTEAAQTRLTCIAGARDDLPHAARQEFLSQTFDRFVEPTPQSSFDRLRDLSNSTVEDDLGCVIEHLQWAGYTAYAADLSRENSDFSVVTTFVPNLGMAVHV